MASVVLSSFCELKEGKWEEGKGKGKEMGRRMSGKDLKKKRNWEGAGRVPAPSGNVEGAGSCKREEEGRQEDVGLMVRLEGKGEEGGEKEV